MYQKLIFVNYIMKMFYLTFSSNINLSLSVSGPSNLSLVMYRVNSAHVTSDNEFAEYSAAKCPIPSPRFNPSLELEYNILSLTLHVSGTHENKSQREETLVTSSAKQNSSIQASFSLCIKSFSRMLLKSSSAVPTRLLIEFTTRLSFNIPT